MFDAHPVLEATFDLGDKPATKQVWSLPCSFDRFMFDPNELEQHAAEVCARRDTKFHDALGHHDANEALKQFALTSEETYVRNAIDLEGRPVRIPAACLKRCQRRVAKRKPLGASMIRKG